MLAAPFVLIFTAVALAQSPGSADKPNSTIPEKQHMGPVDPGKATGGVITPGDPDPGMAKKHPPQGPAETPVIPPKGTPGGAPGPEPK
jgi:hypothetical protein